MYKTLQAQLYKQPKTQLNMRLNYYVKTGLLKKKFTQFPEMKFFGKCWGMTNVTFVYLLCLIMLHCLKKLFEQIMKYKVK